MSDIFSQLQKIQKSTDKIVSSNTDLFQSNLEKMYRQIEKSLTDMLAAYAESGNINKINFEFALMNKRNIEQVLTYSGFYQYVSDYVSSEQDLIDNAVKQFRIFDYKSRIGGTSRTAINAMQKMNYDTIASIGQQATDKLYNAIYQGLITDTGLNEAIPMIRAIAEKEIGEKLSYIKTVADTEMMKFNRTVINSIAEQTGWNERLYIGPVDGIIRKFCLKHVGKVYSIEKIKKMDNGQLPNVLVTGGGYNCRHTWTAVPDGYKPDKEMISDVKSAKEHAVSLGA